MAQDNKKIPLPGTSKTDLADVKLSQDEGTGEQTMGQSDPDPIRDIAALMGRVASGKSQASELRTLVERSMIAAPDRGEFFLQINRLRQAGDIAVEMAQGSRSL